jgi:hypothetical protein
MATTATTTTATTTSATATTGEPPEVQLDREKLKDVVHYICDRCPPSDLGNVKLHKILYFADMLHFNDTAQPLTGVEYVKQPFGPTARHLTWAVAELEREGRLGVSQRSYYGFTKRDYTSLAPPVRARLTNLQVQLLDHVIDFVCARTAREISELSHNAAWEAARIGEVLPYYTVMGWEPGELTDDDIAWAVTEGERLRPQIEGDA